jgi:putative ABC transport system permease protein
MGGWRSCRPLLRSGKDSGADSQSRPTKSATMNMWKLMLRSLRFYWRTNLGVLLGAALATAILVGALAVGDSVVHTLQRVNMARLGDTRVALVAAERFFREELAADLERELNGPVAPLLLVPAAATTADGARRVNEVQIVGVDERFWRLGNAADLLRDAGADEVVVNERLAARLGVRAGDTIIVRFEQPSFISRDAPLSGEIGESIAMHAKVRAVAGDDQFGRFSLQANQVPPATVFVPLTELQRHLDRPGRANALLVGAEVTPAEAGAAVRKHWRLADAELELRALPEQHVIELRTERVFIEPAVAGVAQSLAPDAMGVLTYFVNEIRIGERVTRYSVVSAVDEKFGAALAERGPRSAPAATEPEIIFNSWLAEDLDAQIGDEVVLRYFVVGEQRQLREESATFRLREVVPIQGAAADPELLPKFPGLHGTKHCGEWAPGIPIDLSKLRTKDQRYWETYQGTPKAFIPLAAGQRIWNNRFGDLTAVRFPAERHTPAELERALKEKLDPATFGLFFQPVREQALAASRQALDFGQLFVGFSLFLIVAALMLMAMLFVLSLEQRNEEAGLLLAVGYRPAQVRRRFLLEGFGLALVGVLLGVPAGALYTRAALSGLSSIWRATATDVRFSYHAELSSLATGVVAALIAAGLAMWIVSRKQAQRPAAQLLAMGSEEVVAARVEGGPGPGSATAATISLVSALALLLLAGGGRNPQTAITFFGAGSLLLVAGIAFTYRLLLALAGAKRTASSLRVIGVRGAARRRGRSLTIVAVLACGIFLVVAVSAFRHDPLQGARERRSGTGGFALFGQSALPVYEPLPDVAAVALRVRDGDEASCLNLNRAVQPRLLGVRAEELAKREAFTFVAETGRAWKGAPANAWWMLDRCEADGAVPAIGDQQTVIWSLGKKLGDTLTYSDDRGNPFQIRIVGIVATSILQGALLISEQNFLERFPSVAGYRAFLIDAPWERADEIATTLSRELQERGLEIVPAWQRLAEFQAVENGYIAIFQALGGLGLLLGSAGLGIVVLRNVLERRNELALLRAVGFRRRGLRWLVLSEHWLLLLLGAGCGVLAATIAVLPALRSPGSQIPYFFLAATVLAVLASGLLWIWLATAAALRGPLLNALRNE